MDVIILSLISMFVAFLQARSYIQSLSYKPKVPWERIFPSIVDPKGTCKHSVVHLNLNDQHPPYSLRHFVWAAKAGKKL